MVEEVIDLSGLVVGSDGGLLICADTFTLGPIALADLFPKAASTWKTATTSRSLW